MDEPIKKRAKIEEIDIDGVLGVFQQHLLRNCLCTFSEFELQKLYNVLRTDSTSRLTRNQKLLLITSIQLFCDVAIKQNIESQICAGIANICNTFARHEIELTDYFLKLSEDPDQYISFATSGAVSSFFLIVRSHNNDQSLIDEDDEIDELIPGRDDDQMLLCSLTESLVECSRLGSESFSLDAVSFSLNVLKRLLTWQKVQAHMLVDSLMEDDYRPAVENCRALTVIDSQRIKFMQIKCMCMNALKSRWPVIVNNFKNLIIENDPMYDYHIVTFLNLWATIISYKTCLPVDDTKLFYSNLDTYIQLLSPNIPPFIWKHVLNLLNEVLCYGNTLAIQGMGLEEEPCDLAHFIVRNVKDPRNRNRNLLHLAPYRGGSERFGSNASDGDKVLLKILILVILKAVAITVAETRYDSSSDSSIGSDLEDVDNDMVVISRSIGEVLDRLDARVKQLLFFHPETPLAQWIVQVFADQNDCLIESMVCCLDVAVGLCYRETASAQLRQKLNPTITFLQFLQTVSFDVDVLLKLLISNKTCFLLYIRRYLKYACKNWREFIDTCPNEIGRVITLLINLRKSIKDSVRREKIVYDDIGPVLKLLKKCTKCSST